MTGSRANLKVFEEEVGVKASRSETPMVGPMLPASTYLAAVHDVGNREIDNAITQYNRDFPHGADWQGHLVSLTSYFGQYLDAEGSTYYQYERCSRTDLLGAKMFDHLRATHGIIQSLDGFQSNFNEFGGTILKNLDWRNVGVAGGSMLACLTEHNIGNLLKNSDIDLFIWGLDTVEAQKKVEHIKHTIAANTRSFSAAYLVERSAGAVTFIPQNGNRGRKVQVILRQFSNPASILASFDLDPVCIYFDGNEVWLSLRAIRAFYTGYTTTMGAICSSFAARIIKYATRGFGILVRPEEGDPGADDLYVEMESILREQEASITTQFFKLPWSGRDNFGAVFKTIKAAELGCWTHAFSSLASLAALWNLAHATGRIGQLMDEVGTASQIYGLYEG
ncbi:hypothetical protein A4X13_0g2803 [Tilletia indica]|uniref:Uncharacterized protein n=1 Tax=Tilletia indica TaxID=43049 RepID=A0A177TPC5_9BASI|nr:hypothetical protein A4X13_0g2803 [Tilletia indica]